jgi:hypothetical protein
MSSTPRTDALIGQPADVLFAHACQLERDLAKLMAAAKPFLDGFTYDQGHSDLDSEQPIHSRVTLGQWRMLHFTLACIAASSRDD